MSAHTQFRRVERKENSRNTYCNTYVVCVDPKAAARYWGRDFEVRALLADRVAVIDDKVIAPFTPEAAAAKREQ